MSDIAEGYGGISYFVPLIGWKVRRSVLGGLCSRLVFCQPRAALQMTKKLRQSAAGIR